MLKLRIYDLALNQNMLNYLVIKLISFIDDRLLNIVSYVFIML